MFGFTVGPGCDNIIDDLRINSAKSIAKKSQANTPITPIQSAISTFDTMSNWQKELQEGEQMFNSFEGGNNQQGGGSQQSGGEQQQQQQYGNSSGNQGGQYGGSNQQDNYRENDQQGSNGGQQYVK